MANLFLFLFFYRVLYLFLFWLIFCFCFYFYFSDRKNGLIAKHNRTKKFGKWTENRRMGRSSFRPLLIFWAVFVKICVSSHFFSNWGHFLKNFLGSSIYLSPPLSTNEYFPIYFSICFNRK